MAKQALFFWLNRRTGLWKGCFKIQGHTFVGRVFKCGALFEIGQIKTCHRGLTEDYPLDSYNNCFGSNFGLVYTQVKTPNYSRYHVMHRIGIGPKLSDVSLRTRMQDSLVADEDVKKSNKETNQTKTSIFDSLIINA